MNGNDYISRQAERDREYTRAWESEETRKWLASLPPEKRRELEAEGVLKPLLPKHGNGMLEKDAADSPLAREEATFVDKIDEEPPSATPTGTGESADDKMLDMLRRLIAEVLSQSNARLTLECLALACGLATLQGESMTHIARRHGISRAAISKRCVDITEKLNLPPSRAMRSKKARQAYRNAQIEIHNAYERISHPGQQVHHQ
jgi:hypothetical protein